MLDFSQVVSGPDLRPHARRPRGRRGEARAAGGRHHPLPATAGRRRSGQRVLHLGQRRQALHLVDLRTRPGRRARPAAGASRATWCSRTSAPASLEKYGLDAEHCWRASPTSSTARSTGGATTTPGRSGGRTRRWCRRRSGGSSSTPGCATHRPSRARTSTGTSPPVCSVSGSSPRCSSGSAPAAASISTSPWPRPSCTPTSGRRPISPGTTDPGSPTRGTTRSSRSPTAPGRVHGRSAAAAGDRGGAHRRAGAVHGIARRGAADPRRPVAQVPDFPTLEARFERFGFLVAEVRTVQELAETPWARERDVFVEVEPGARVTGAPFRSDGATIGVRAPAPRFAEHTRAVLAERCGLTVDDLDAARGRRDHHVGLSQRARCSRTDSPRPSPAPVRAIRTRAPRPGCASRASARAPRTCGPCRS